MRELPMLLNGHGVRATMAGMKTQTCRPVRPQPPSDTWLDSLVQDPRQWIAIAFESGSRMEGTPIYHNPLGVPDDLLYVRETHTWVTLAENEYDPEDPHHKRHPRGYPVVMIYRADWQQEVGYGRVYACQEPRWRPSIHMPKWAARTWCRVTGVRIEKGPYISEEDAIAEGFAGYETYHTMPGEQFVQEPDEIITPAEEFMEWWENQYPGIDWRFVTSYEVIDR